MTQQEFHLGQIFIGIYPPEAAHWCNEGQLYHIDEIAPDPETGERRFEIVENVPYEPTDEEIAQMEAAAEELRAKNIEQLEFVRTLDLNDESAVKLAASLPMWTPDTDYEDGDYVIMDGAVYRCKVAHNSNEALVATMALVDGDDGATYLDKWSKVEELV